MAITHDDLSVTKFRSTDIGSKLALFLVIFSVLCGLAAFILCLTAESTRSEATWLYMSTPSSKGYKCFYSGSGRTPLACTIAAFLLLAIAMFFNHGYMLVAITNPQLPSLVAWVTVPHDTRATTSRDLSWQACCLFLTTWVFFALSEVLIMIGIGVESSHLSNWASPRPKCHAVLPGIFAVAGVSALITVFLGVGLYVTALRTQRIHLEEENARQSGRIPNIANRDSHHPPSAPMINQNQQQFNKSSTSA